MMPDAVEKHYVNKPRPFLKWAGGKQGVLKQYLPYLPRRDQIRRYYEPFIGSAAVYFFLQPACALLSDSNEKLVELYRVVQNDVEALIAALRPHRNEADHYYQVRAQDPATLTAVQRAARLIFLNKTCYNGLYRENRKGRFNVPFGRYKNPTICDEPRLRAASQALRGAALQAADFETACSSAEPGDFVYLDPPYAPISQTSNFTSYSKDGFDAAEQHRLAQTVARLSQRGCRVMLSNSDASLVRELYDRNGYHFVEIRARRSINSKAHKRGPINELLILNYAVEW